MTSSNEDLVKILDEKINKIHALYNDCDGYMPNINSDYTYEIIYDLFFNNVIPEIKNDIAPEIIVCIGDYYYAKKDNVCSDCTDYGIECKCYLKKTLDHYKLACDRGSNEGKLSLGMYYRYVKNYEKAKVYLQSAADHNASAMTELAYVYDLSESNSDISNKYYKMAIDKCIAHLNLYKNDDIIDNLDFCFAKIADYDDVYFDKLIELKLNDRKVDTILQRILERNKLLVVKLVNNYCELLKDKQINTIDISI